MMTSSPTTGLAKMAGLIQTIRQLDPEMPAQTVLCLIMVAQSMPDGILLNDLAKQAGLSSSAAARNAMFLSKEKGIGIPGHDLVNVEIVREDKRQRRLTLTTRGERFLGKCLKILE